MSKVIVAGGVGFVGSHLVKMLTEEGHDVFVLDAFNQSFLPPINPLYAYNIN